MSLLKISSFLLGFTSLFAIPSFGKIIFAHIFLIINFFIILMLFLINFKSIKLDKYDFFLLMLFILYFSSTIFGAINSNSFAGIITSIIVLLTFFVVFGTYKINIDTFYCLLKGFLYSSLFTSLFVIIDDLQYYILKTYKPLTDQLFSDKFLYKAHDHSIENLINIAGFVFYRSSGFSWDPGLSVTGVAIAIVLLNERIVVLKWEKFAKLLMLISVILSISKTSIISLCAYFLIKYLKIDVMVLKYSSTKKIHLLNILIIFALFFLAYIGFFISYDGSGNIRHIKYFSSIFYYAEVKNLLEIFFGYGYTGVGYFFNTYVPWLKSNDHFVFGPNLNPESTLTNIFFYGGLIGLMFWIYIFLLFLNSHNTKIKLVLFTIILVSFGYAINSIWFNIIIFSLIFIAKNKGDISYDALYRRTLL